MSGIEVAILAASVATSAAGAVSARNQAKTNAKQSKIDASASAERLRRQQAKALGKTRAAFGASGTQMAGTSLLVLQDEAAQAEQNRRLVLHEGDIQAKRYKAKGREAMYEAGGSILGSVAMFGAAGGFKKTP